MRFTVCCCTGFTTKKLRGITNLQGLVTVGEADVHGGVAMHQAHLVLELIFNPIKQVADVATDNVDHRELPRRSEECVSLHCLVRICNS